MAAIPAGAGSLLGKRLGKYEILALLALGGTAEIYLARIGGAAGFEKYVVVKCLHDHLADDQEFVKMFLDEARLAAHLDHSNIVQTFELGEHDNRYYMVMEFLAGLSLAMVVRRAGERLPGGRLPVPLVLNIVAQACAGLHYAHEKAMNGKALNIVHRDISPQNLVVSFEGVVKVVDFGIAKAELRETRTRSGTIKGKFAYMSPEQCVANNVDRRTDVFALGVIAHELLTGRRLFKRPSPYETYQAVIECNVGIPSSVNHELDPGLDDVIMKAVAKDKEGRYPTAEAFGDALQSYLHHRGKGSGPGDVGRFLDDKFAIEIEEHGGRMRELIAGRVIDAGSWDEDEDDKQKAAKARAQAKAAARGDTIDVRRGAKPAGAPGGPGGKEEKSMILETGDIEEMRASEASLEGVIHGLNGRNNSGKAAPAGARDPDEQEEDTHPGDTGDPEQDGEMPADRTRIESNPLDVERLSASEISQAPPLAPPPMTNAMANAKFPAAANLPTMIAEPDPDDAPELARTEMGAPVVDPRGATREQASVQVSQSMQYAAIGGVPGVPGRGSRPQVAQRGSGSGSQSVPPAIPATMALDPSGGASGANGPPAMPMPMPAVLSGSSPMPSEYGTDSSPHPQQSGATHALDSGAYVQAAQLMSPVGEGYPQVDWSAAAAMPVRVLPPWMLATLFVLALAVALGVTFLIAVIVR